MQRLLVKVNGKEFQLIRSACITYLQISRRRSRMYPAADYSIIIKQLEQLIRKLDKCPGYKTT